MESTTDVLRSRFEVNLVGLDGRVITVVDYWDVHNVAAAPARWDYGTWQEWIATHQHLVFGRPPR